MGKIINLSTPKGFTQQKAYKNVESRTEDGSMRTAIISAGTGTINHLNHRMKSKMAPS